MITVKVRSIEELTKIAFFDERGYLIKPDGQEVEPEKYQYLGEEILVTEAKTGEGSKYYIHESGLSFREDEVKIVH